jgi:hypothetical protein
MTSFSRRFFFGGCAAAPALLAGSSQETLSEQIGQLLARFDGKLWLYAKNLDTGNWFGLRHDEKVRTASTIKLPILCALFDLVAAGKVRWDEKLTLHDADKISGSGVLHELSDGTQLTVRDVAHVMIVVSDNTATNLILDRITADAVNDYLDRIGLKITRSLRKVRGDGNDLKPPSGMSKAEPFAREQALRARSDHTARDGGAARNDRARQGRFARSVQRDHRHPEAAAVQGRHWTAARRRCSQQVRSARRSAQRCRHRVPASFAPGHRRHRRRHAEGGLLAGQRGRDPHR